MNNIGFPNLKDKSMPVDILGVGLLASNGGTPYEVWSRLAFGMDSLSPLDLDPTNRYLKTKLGHQIRYLEDKSILSLATIAIDQALATLPEAITKNIDWLCVGSSSASYELADKNGERFYRPSDLSNVLAANLKIQKRTQFSQACTSASMAIAYGVDLIRSGAANVVLAGGADILTRSVIGGFEAVRIHGDYCRPFDVNRSVTNLGEGAAFILLARPGIGKKPIAKITGIGISSDAHDSVLPETTGIMSSILQATQQDRKVDFVIAHGTGTKASDEVESIAIANTLGRVPTSSFKGGIGHIQGATGAVSVALAITSLSAQGMFPTVGMLSPDPAIADRIHLLTEFYRTEIHNVLCITFGTWGTNVNILVSEG